MNRYAIAGIVAVAGLATSASAQVSAIYSNVAAAGNNAVPGRPGKVFAVGTTSSTAFDRPFLSPDGTKILFAGVEEATLPLTDDLEIIFSGSLSPTNTVTARLVEDEPTFFDATVTWSLFRTRGGINNNGDFAVSGDSTALTGVDDVVVKFTAIGPVFSLAAREGQPSPIAGQNFGSTSDSAHILANGDVRFRSILAPTTTKLALFNVGTTNDTLSETDVTTPTGQLTAPDQTVDTFNSERFQSNADGTAWIAIGDLNGPTTTDLFIVKNNNVLAQEGSPLPGETTPNVSLLSGDAGSQQISANGDVISFRGTYAGGTGSTAQDFVRVITPSDGANTVARTDEPIFTGATENFDDAVFGTTFFINAVNNNGDYIIGGTTNNANVETDAVLVLNSTTVVARESDPVDLNGNGLLDDDAFIDVFGNDDIVLTDDRKVYFVASVQNAAGTSTGNALLFIDLDPEPPVCCVDFNNDTEVDFSDIESFLAAFAAMTPGTCKPGADFNDDGEFDFSDIEVFLAQYTAAILGGC